MLYQNDETYFIKITDLSFIMKSYFQCSWYQFAE